MIRTIAALAVLSCSLGAQSIFVDVSASGAADGSSWADAYPDLQPALAAASSGSSIWVAAGVYRPAPIGGSSAVSFVLPDGVSVYGGFDGTETLLSERAGLFDTTVLSGDLAGDDQPGFLGMSENSYHVLRVGAGTTGAVIDGFTVSGGNAAGSGPADRSGGALFSAGVVTARNVTFTGNRAIRRGGAVHVEGSGATVLEDCMVTGNYAGSDGGGVHQGEGALSLLRTTLEDNQCEGNGGGVFFAGDVFIAKCEFRDNHAVIGGGGIYNDHGDGTLTSSIFVANSADLGGGIYSAGATDGVEGLNVASCTIYGNTSTNALGGAGVYSTQTGFYLGNSIVWENVGVGGNDFPAQYSGPAKLADFTCIQSMDSVAATTLGVGNVSASPAFADPDGVDDVLGTVDDDLRLTAGSSCIDAGADTGTLPITDLSGLPRLSDDPETPDTGAGGPPTVDLGALEYHSLFSLKTSISVSGGGVVPLFTEVGPAFAGELYLVLGTVSGNYPGLSAGGHTMLLNPDSYFFGTLNAPNQPPLAASFGVLDGAGAAFTTFTLPAGMDPILAGLQAHHACAVISSSLMVPLYTTTAFPLNLVP